MDEKFQIFELLQITANNIIFNGKVNQDSKLIVELEEIKNLIICTHLMFSHGIKEAFSNYFTIFQNLTLLSLPAASKKNFDNDDYISLSFEWLLSVILDGTLSSRLSIISNDFELLSMTYEKEALLMDFEMVDQIMSTLQGNIEDNELLIVRNSDIIISETKKDFANIQTQGLSYLVNKLKSPRVPSSHHSRSSSCSDFSQSKNAEKPEDYVEEKSDKQSSKLGDQIAPSSTFIEKDKTVTVIEIDDTKTADNSSETLNKSKFMEKGSISETLYSSKEIEFKNSIQEAIEDEDQFMDEELYARLGLSKVIFTQEVDSEFMGFSAEEELINSINACKARILTPNIPESEKKKLVNLVIDFRWKLYSRRNSDLLELPDSLKFGQHEFIQYRNGITTISNKKYQRRIQCEACHKKIYHFISTTYQCMICKIIVHPGCINRLPPPCIGSRVDSFSINLKLCPEIGMSAQAFRCGYCKLNFSQKNEAPKRCDYSGLYYCSSCHTNDLHMIPARIVRNWDFSIYPVSRQAFTLLELIWSKRLINLSKACTHLLMMVPAFSKIQEQRKKIKNYRYYLDNCKEALKNNIYQEFKHRFHLLEYNETFTLEDLLEIHDGRLGKLLGKTDEMFRNHIKNKCHICHDRGHFCIICKSSDTIYPFDEGAIVCSNCNGIFHKSCFNQSNCETCARIAKYNLQLSQIQ